MELNPKEYSVKEIAFQDLKEVAEIHKEAFPESMLSFLGKETIFRYYEWLLSGPHEGFMIGAFRNGQLAGFCFGGVYRGAMSGFLRKNRIFLIFKIICTPKVFFQPLFMDRIKIAIKALGFKKQNKPVHQRPISFGILSLAVKPAFHKCGIGSILMEAAQSAAKNRGFDKMHLTVERHNFQALCFYEAIGWRKKYQNSTWFGGMEKEI